MNVLLGTCCALLAVVTAVTWIGSLALPGLQASQEVILQAWANMYITEHANKPTCPMSLIMCFLVMAKIRFFETRHATR